MQVFAHKEFAYVLFRVIGVWCLIKGTMIGLVGFPLHFGTWTHQVDRWQSFGITVVSFVFAIGTGLWLLRFAGDLAEWTASNGPKVEREAPPNLGEDFEQRGLGLLGAYLAVMGLFDLLDTSAVDLMRGEPLVPDDPAAAGLLVSSVFSLVAGVMLWMGRTGIVQAIHKLRTAGQAEPAINDEAQ